MNSMTFVLLLVLALLALLAAGGALFWAWRVQRAHVQVAVELHDYRAQMHALSNALDVWQWRTDAQHRLILLRAPVGTRAAVPSITQPLLLWNCFDVGDGSLRTQLESLSPFTGLTAWVSDDASGERQAMQLRGAAVLDASGRYAGHIGTAREMGDPGAAREPTPQEAQTAADHEAFSYTIAHDLRAPIRVVEGFTRIIKEDYGSSFDRIGNDHLERVLSAAARMNNMIDSLLTLSQLSVRPLSRQAIDLSQLAHYIVDDLRRESPAREVAVEIEPGLRASGDPTLLRVALENLFGNAWKYTAKRSDARITFERCEHLGQSALMVRDNGAGFDMRFAERLFGVFQRLHSASEFQGTGIGLASALRIIRRHGGDIWAEGEVDRGARFRFTLPE